MQFIDSATERSTAVTDVILAVVALGCAAGLYPVRDAGPFRVSVWMIALCCLAVAALVGAVIHGFKMDTATRKLLWQPVNLSLGLTMSLFVVAAVDDCWGTLSAQRTLPLMLVLAVVFFFVVRLFPGGFTWFLLYEALAMLFSLGVYGYLAYQGRAGAEWMTAGILLTIVAAILQAGKIGPIRVYWELDHNGVFHVVQTVGVVVLFVGIRALTTTTRP